MYYTYSGGSHSITNLRVGIIFVDDSFLSSLSFIPSLSSIHKTEYSLNYLKSSTLTYNNFYCLIQEEKEASSPLSSIVFNNKLYYGDKVYCQKKIADSILLKRVALSILVDLYFDILKQKVYAAIDSSIDTKRLEKEKEYQREICSHLKYLPLLLNVDKCITLYNDQSIKPYWYEKELSNLKH